MALLVLAAVMASITPGPVDSASMRGTASWYCGHGSVCTRGYGPGDMVGAIDRAQTPWEKGDRVIVTHEGVSQEILIVDVCGCPDNRLIDITSGAFQAVGGDLFLDGVINISISDAQGGPRVTLPPTDTAP